MKQQQQLQQLEAQRMLEKQQQQQHQQQLAMQLQQQQMCARPLLGEDWATNTEADLSPYTDLGGDDTDSFDSFCNLPPESQLLPPVKMEVADTLVEEPTSILLDPPCSSTQSSMYRCVNPMEVKNE